MKSLFKWCGTLVVVATMPLWVPVFAAGQFLDGTVGKWLRDVHETLWGE